MSKVLISGCFTLKHQGHLHLIQEAAKLGDVYVALNSDDYIIRTKGKEKLMLNWDDRAKSLLDTKLVKDIIYFDEDTPREVAIHIKPDFVVVGSDHNDEDMKWAKVIEEWGGKIVYVPRLKDENGVDISTTNILNDLTKRVADRAINQFVDRVAEESIERLYKKYKDS